MPAEKSTSVTHTTHSNSRIRLVRKQADNWADITH